MYEAGEFAHLQQWHHNKVWMMHFAPLSVGFYGIHFSNRSDFVIPDKMEQVIFGKGMTYSEPQELPNNSCIHKSSSHAECYFVLFIFILCSALFMYVCVCVCVWVSVCERERERERERESERVSVKHTITGLGQWNKDLYYFLRLPDVKAWGTDYYKNSSLTITCVHVKQ
jgi:hypothetical protein